MPLRLVDGTESGDLGLAAQLHTLSLAGSSSLNSPSSPSLLNRTLDDIPTQPSSVTAPVLSQPASPGHLVRSKTLPRLRTKSILGSADPPDAELAPLEPERLSKLRRWILAVTVVDFDLDIGPVVDTLYPPVRMSPEERQNVAFSSFPDSATFDTGSQSYSYRIRMRDISSGNTGFIYGYVMFLQKRDKSSKRGYLQRSVAILSYHPFPSLFTSIINILGPLYFSHGTPMLESACHNISNWPDPVPGSTLELGFLGSVINVELPDNSGHQQSIKTSSFGETFDPKIHILASIPLLQPAPLALFSSFVTKLWSLWECLILSEPILLFGSSPSDTSIVVWWLRDFLRPLPLFTDFRPYFHIQEQDFDQLVNKNPPKAGLLVGVTNPFFEGMCKHWPNVLSLERGARASTGTGTVTNEVGGASKAKAATRNGANGTAADLGPPPGFHTKHQRYISRDKDLLRRMEEAVRKGGALEVEVAHLVRAHFSSRTSQMLVPLNRYLMTLIPPSPTHTPSSSLPSSPTPPSPIPSPSLPSPTPSASATSTTSLTLNTTPRIRPFLPTQFLASLKTHGSPLPFRSSAKQKDFYERWLRTPAFGLWLTQRVEEVTGVLEKRSRVS
ncbi:hypothetical protein BOTBODRAFT_133411 [Botryobasidium botryosum FD-172 SS1]|uniref:Uncharacterized protein n=1 Tax=Botryobasidium botryosum (strain FD-172 SS1) TaxID=930990 RepID=A0A067MFM9_BOTB1|nr:hypothetical protein BOTBODRAFT_133411 [Botryobasidium botryosum FD-172 SS1]